ncbi:MAG: Flp family type IVb pilin [Chloroflexi bacterium]|nr:Flp family type IVb pilin [Chloroflexota bacterium]
MRRLVSRTAIEDAGQSMVEYALILAIVSIAAVGALALLGPQVVNAINAVTAAF